MKLRLRTRPMRCQLCNRELKDVAGLKPIGEGYACIWCTTPNVELVRESKVRIHYDVIQQDECYVYGRDEVIDYT